MQSKRPLGLALFQSQSRNMWSDRCRCRSFVSNVRCGLQNWWVGPLRRVRRQRGAMWWARSIYTQTRRRVWYGGARVHKTNAEQMVRDLDVKWLANKPFGLTMRLALAPMKQLHSRQAERPLIAVYIIIPKVTCWLFVRLLEYPTIDSSGALFGCEHVVVCAREERI